jgi:hypothetical protein
MVTAGLVLMLVYMGRGFHGYQRKQAEQLGAGQYEPGNTTVSNSETKKVESVEKSSGAGSATVTINKTTSEEIGSF